jgi:hypothetical protein
LLYAVVAVINKVTGKSLSATGIIMGVLNIIKQGIFNVGIMFSNVLNNIGVWVANTVSNAKSYFYSLLSTVIKVIAGIASLLNKLPFVDFDYSGLTSAAADYAQKAADAANKPFEYTSVLSGTTNLKDAYNAGYQWGSTLGKSKENAGIDISDMVNNISDIASTANDIKASSKDTADNTSTSAEDLKWLRECAERQSINQFTTAEIKVDMGGIIQNISSEMDIDGVVRELEMQLTETLESVAEGNHI